MPYRNCRPAAIDGRWGQQHVLPLFPSGNQRGFYIFTTITNDTYQIITFKMTSTTIPAERSLTYTFTTIAHVASHAGMTC